jgi:hypothetical protein
MNLHLMPIEKLKELRKRKAADLAWAKDNKLWGHADAYLCDIDSIDYELTRREYSREEKP